MMSSHERMHAMHFIGFLRECAFASLPELIALELVGVKNTYRRHEYESSRALVAR
jgi:hypothetical protein